MLEAVEAPAEARPGTGCRGSQELSFDRGDRGGNCLLVELKDVGKTAIASRLKDRWKAEGHLLLLRFGTASGVP